MALSKTYYTRQDVQLDDTSTAALMEKSLLYAIKALLKGEKTGTTGTAGAPPAGSLWTCYYSCDSVAAGSADDGVDRWGGGTFDGTKIVRGTAAAVRSWFVLKSPAALTALGVSFYLIIAYDGASDSQFSLTLCKAAPTGGTTTARPTSTDEVSLGTALQMGDTTAGVVHRCGYVVDANGNFWMSFRKASAGIAYSLFAVTVLSGSIAGDLFPVVMVYNQLTTGRGAGSAESSAGNGYWAGNGFVTGTQSGGAVTRSSANTVGPASNGGSGLQFVSNAAFYSAATVNNSNSLVDVMPITLNFVGTGCNGPKGRIPDWWAGNAAKTVGSLVPASGNSEHVNVGHLWLPNGGVAPTF